MYRKTGDIAANVGVYHSECRCRAEISVRKGDRFPECPVCRRAVGWLFTRSRHTGQAPRLPRDPASKPEDASES